MSDSHKTRLVHAARTGLVGEVGTVNPAVVRCSTVLYRDMATRRTMRARRENGVRQFTYGASGTPTTFALEDAISEIERGERTVLFPSGLAAIAHVFHSLLAPGDHVLLAETIYGPARAIALNFLARRGVACEFYRGGHEAVAQLLRPSTRLVYLDNPGSIVYDIQDVRQLARLLSGRETLLAVDNTWGCPGLYTPLALGADVSIVALTKYVAGHSDLVMGSVTAGRRCAEKLWRDAALLGQTVSPDAAYDALKGLRTAAARLAMHQAHAAEVARWLARQASVARILYPALPGDPGHGLFRRDFAGANGLLSIAFKPHITQLDADRLVDSLRLFGIGASWGGFESLALTYPRIHGWDGGALVRLHIGLEDPADLIADLSQAMSALGNG